MRFFVRSVQSLFGAKHYISYKVLLIGPGFGFRVGTADLASQSGRSQRIQKVFCRADLDESGVSV